MKQSALYSTVRLLYCTVLYYTTATETEFTTTLYCCTVHTGPFEVFIRDNQQYITQERALRCGSLQLLLEYESIQLCKKARWWQLTLSISKIRVEEPLRGAGCSPTQVRAQRQQHNNDQFDWVMTTDHYA